MPFNYLHSFAHLVILVFGTEERPSDHCLSALPSFTLVRGDFVKEMLSNQRLVFGFNSDELMLLIKIEIFSIVTRLIYKLRKFLQKHLRTGGQIKLQKIVLQQI